MVPNRTIDGIYRYPVLALCADGQVRVAKARAYWDGQRLCMDGDTWFSVPARVRAHGKTVAGYISGREKTPECNAEYVFHAYLYRKNAGVIQGRKA